MKEGYVEIKIERPDNIDVAKQKIIDETSQFFESQRRNYRIRNIKVIFELNLD